MHVKDNYLANFYWLPVWKNLFHSALIGLVCVSIVNGQDYGYNTNGKCIYSNEKPTCFIRIKNLYQNPEIRIYPSDYS